VRHCQPKTVNAASAIWSKLRLKRRLLETAIIQR
jgi:hypothetical protein